MEISGERDSRGSRVAMHRTCTDRRYHVELLPRLDTFPFISFRFTALYIRHDTRLVTPRQLAVSFPLSLPFSLSLLIPALLSAVCALSSVVFIVYDVVDDEVADDKIYSDAPRSSGPAGRPSQSECLISYFGFSYFAAPRSTSFFS